MPTVEFFFYAGCPWTYLAFTRLREAAMRAGGAIAWKPVLISRVRAAVQGGAMAGQVQAEPARARYQAKDLGDWARFCGVRIGRTGPYPVPADAAQAVAVAAIAAGAGESFMEEAFSAGFERGADLDAPAALARIGQQAGLDVAYVQRALDDAGVRRVLEANSDELVRRGGFDSPTMFIGDDMYFGNDRMPLVELALSRAGSRPLVAPGAHGQG